jgi:hypothetical protein
MGYIAQPRIFKSGLSYGADLAGTRHSLSKFHSVHIALCVFSKGFGVYQSAVYIGMAHSVSQNHRWDAGGYGIDRKAVRMPSCFFYPGFLGSALHNLIRPDLAVKDISMQYGVVSGYV